MPYLLQSSVLHSPEMCPGRLASLTNPGRKVDVEVDQPEANVIKVFKVIQFIKGTKVINVIKVHLELLEANV